MKSRMADHIRHGINTCRKRYIISYIIVVFLLRIILQWNIVSDTFNILSDTIDFSFIFFGGLIVGSVSDKRLVKLLENFNVESLPNPEGKRVIAYGRVSSQNQVINGHGLEAQKSALIEMKKKQKPSVIYWCEDKGISGKNFEDRKLKPILELIDYGKVDEIWVSEVSRVGRDFYKLIGFFGNIFGNGVSVRTPEYHYNPDKEFDFIMIIFKAWWADSETKQKDERTKRGHIESFKGKKWPKKHPICYQITTEGWIKKIPGIENIVLEIYSMYLEKESKVHIVRYITERYGDILGYSLNNHHLNKILTDPLFKGRPEHHGHTVPDESLRFVSDDLFDSVQEIKTQKDVKKEQREDPFIFIIKKFTINSLEFLERVNLIFECKSCRSILIKNGTDFSQNPPQMRVRCNCCNTEFRVPLKSEMEKMEKYCDELCETFNPLIKDASKLLSQTVDRNHINERPNTRKIEPQGLLDNYFGG